LRRQGTGGSEAELPIYLRARLVGRITHPGAELPVSEFRDKSGCRRRADLTRLALQEGII
jgi:hypothetical protein